MFRRRHRREDDRGLWDRLVPEHLWARQRGRRKRRDRDKDEGGVPVEPNKPKNLSGGAAAALEFDDEQ